LAKSPWVEDTVLLEKSLEDDQGNHASCSDNQAGNAWCRVPCVLVSTPAYEPSFSTSEYSQETTVSLPDQGHHERQDTDDEQ
jgi:hypothetical protein